METLRCNICKRPMNVKEDPLSLDCGGDCLGCIRECEGIPDLRPIDDYWSQEIKSSAKVSESNTE